MKVVKDNSFYVQRKDIASLNYVRDFIPESLGKILNKVNSSIIEAGDAYVFIEITNIEDIDTINNCNWIIDYDDIKDLDHEELINLGQSITDERNSISRKYNSLSEEEKKNNIELVRICKILDYKIESVRDIILFKDGLLKFTLPDCTSFQVEDKSMKGIFKKILKKR